MQFYIGLDVGGTKTAGALFDHNGQEIAQLVCPTPHDYGGLVTTCASVVDELSSKIKGMASVGVGVPYGVANMPFFSGQPFERDLSAKINRPVRVGNDANCAALAEAIDGAGQGFSAVFGLIIGTGVGGGYAINGKVREGANGLMGEIGHIPLPHYVESDGPLVECGCGQKGCIEKLVCGAGLARLYTQITGKEASATVIAAAAQKGDDAACAVLDRYFTVVAKAMVAIIHTFDPDVITVSGGLNALPGLYVEVPKRWGQYALTKDLRTKFVTAKHGAMAGLRGAAWLWRG